MTDKLMRIQGMTCAHCEKTVAEALTAAGAVSVVADWTSGQAQLDPSTASDEQLSAAVEEAGYRVLSIEPAPREQKRFTPLVGGRTHDYDLVVLGSGSAAFAAGITATEAGARVALMESNVVGGTCVNVGCVPSKAMLAPAEAYFRAGHHPFKGIETSANGFDLGAMVDSKAELVEQLRAEKYRAEYPAGRNSRAEELGMVSGIIVALVPSPYHHLDRQTAHLQQAPREEHTKNRGRDSTKPGSIARCLHHDGHRTGYVLRRQCVPHRPDGAPRSVASR